MTRLLSSITETIVAIRYHKENPLPDDYLQHITTVFQTTSVSKFNRDFVQLEIDINYRRRFWKVALSTSVRHHKALLSSSTSSQLAMDNNLDSYKLVFSLANETYKKLQAPRRM